MTATGTGTAKNNSLNYCNTKVARWNVAGTCSPSSSLIRRRNFTFGNQWTTWTSNNKICLPSRLSILAFPVRESCAKSKGKIYLWSKTKKLKEKEYFSQLPSSLLPSSFLKVPNNKLGKYFFHILAAMDSCFTPFRPHHHGIANRLRLFMNA